MGQKKVDKNEKNKKNDDGGTKGETSNTVLMKIDMHCATCASKIVKCAKAFQGMDMMKVESKANKLTIIGKLNPIKLRDKLANKTKKKIDPISPQPKKGINTNNNKDLKDKKKCDANSEKKNDDKKLKEQPLVTTTILKVSLHCQGCIERISKIVSKSKGIQDMNINKDEELIIVKGTMDVKALAKTLQERLKRRVEVIPSKRDKEKEKGGCEKDGGGIKDGGNNSGGKKKIGGGGNGDNVANGGIGHNKEKAKEDCGEGEGKMEKGKIELVAPSYGYSYGYDCYCGPTYMEQVHAPQMFSDENPNACSIM